MEPVSHRVRTLIPFLDYGELTKLKILPKEKMFTAKTVPSRGGKTPCATLSKKLGASGYGIFMEDVINLLLETGCDIQSLSKSKDRLDPDLQKYFKINEFQSLRDLLHGEFVNKNIELQIQAEITDAPNHIEGHPDLLSNECVYDIKTTGRFSAMRTDTIFQLLSYFCLCQVNKLKVTKIGLVLPLQNLVITYNLKDWKWQPFYEELKKTIHAKYQRGQGWSNVSGVEQLIFLLNMQQCVGNHCRVGDVVGYVGRLPALQFFIAGNVTTTVKYTDKFVKSLKDAINKHGTPVFIHSPYVLNLSHPGKGQGSREGDEDIVHTWGGWTFECIRKLFEFAHKSSIKGIVIHCGKRCGEEYYSCVFRMWCSVGWCSQYASKECKLIVETSSGQDGEILCSPHELGNFYLSLPDEVRERIGICVDTCHVFAAGYDPFEYVTILHAMQVPIDLFHYNDSAVKKGALKDRHAGIGKGYIGYDSLSKVLNYAIQNNIPLVHE